MNVPIRMLGIATTIFWIILIGFFVSAAYSFKDFNFSFGEPQFAPGSNKQLLFTLPLHIDNKGYYSLKAFNLTTVFSDAEGAEISRSSTFVPVITQGQNMTIMHNVTLSMDSLEKKGALYLFNDSSLNCAVTAGLNFAELMPSQLSTNLTIPWGAPVYGFTIGQPQYTNVDFSHVRVTAPMSFENHAVFDVAGNIRLEFIDGAGSVLAETQIPVNVPRQTSYAQKVELNVPLIGAASTSVGRHFNVYFSTSMFEYGPLVIPVG